MRLRWAIDRILRLVAAVTTVAAAGLLFFAGIFASDSGTLLSEIISTAIWLGGGILVALLAVAIFNSPMQKPPTGSWAIAGIPLATLLIYLVALAGIAAFCCRNLLLGGV